MLVLVLVYVLVPVLVYVLVPVLVLPYRLILLSIATILTSNSLAFPLFASSIAPCSRRSSITAPHSIADPRAMA